MMLSKLHAALPEPVRAFLVRCEADTALLYNFLGAAISAVAGPLTVFVITKKLTAIEQGYYYTFASLFGLTIFIELGVAQTISISVAHLGSKLKLGRKGTLSGEAGAISELSAVCKFYSGWYVVAAGAAFLLLAIGGSWLLAGQDHTHAVHWFAPWMIFSIGVALGMPTIPLHFILYGLGIVTRISLWRLLNSALRFALLLGCLLAGLGLYAQGIALIGCGLLVAFLPMAYLPLWRRLFTEKAAPIGKVAAGCLNFQWRVAVSWLAGYAAMYLLTPLLFRMVGSENAGRFGATYSLANAAVTVGLIWLNTRVPRLSGLVSSEDHAGFRQLGRRLIVLTGGCGLACLLVLFGLYAVAAALKMDVLHRFLPLSDFLLLAVSCWCYMEFGVLGSLLRCFRSEPLIWESLGTAILMLVLPLLLIPQFGVRGAILGHLASSATALLISSTHYQLYLAKWARGCVSNLLNPLGSPVR